MRKFSLIVLMLSLTAAFGGLWAQSRVPLVVIASEGPAQVILSGRMIGVANPRLTAQVSPGNYELLVRKPGLPEFRQRISVGSGGLTINAPLGGVAVQPAPQPIQPIQPAPQPIQPIQPAPQPIQPAPRVIQPAPQPVQPAPQPQTLQQPQTFQPAPRVTQQAPQAQPTPQFSGPSGTAWTKVLQPQWPFTFLAEFPDGSIVVASEGSSDFYVKESSSNSLQKRTAPQTEGAWADIRGLFISSDGVLTAFANQVGVLRSRDKGLNWTAAGTIKQFNYPFMTSSGILLAGDNARQTQRSSDGGQTWQVVMQGEPQGP